MWRSSAGAILGAAIVLVVAPHCIGWFGVPHGGIGAVTLAHYPKGYDYFVVLALTAASAVFAYASSAGGPPAGPPAARRRPSSTLLTVIVFAAMFLAHDHPYAFMETFHEGEHLTPASVMLDGGRAYADIFFLHGFATDGGLDTLVLRSGGSIRTARRLQAVLDAAALAMLVPIAAELTMSTWALWLAAFVALCAVGAGQVPVFPYFRWLPLLIATWALLRRRPYVAAIASSLGLLWSLDVGVAACAGTAIVVLIYTRRVTSIAIAAVAAPLLVLLATRADLHHFVRDSFVLIPRAIDAVWSLPAKPPAWEWESARYYAPPVIFGLLLALALRRRDMRIAIIAIVSAILFRTAAGRCSWSHTRFGIPLLGIAVVAFLFEPAVRRRQYVFAILLALVGYQYFDVASNVTLGRKLIAGWRSRQRHEAMVAYPMRRAHGIFTYAENASDLAALNDLAQRAGPGPMFDLSGERALYFLLDRRPSTRCPDIAMLSNPELGAEAMRQLAANPPMFVVLSGNTILGSLDGIANRDRVPTIATWIDAHYPVHVQAGRFVVAFPTTPSVIEHPAMKANARRAVRGR
jgi:hypothetical protein